MPDNYNLEVKYRVDIAKWRIDDQEDPDNWQWSLWVYDKVQNKWIQTANLDRPGERVWIDDVNEVNPPGAQPEGT